MALVKIRQIGDELVVVLNDDAKRLLDAKDGDTLILTKAEDGRVQLSAHSAEVRREIALGSELMHKYDATFQRLAKS